MSTTAEAVAAEFPAWQVDDRPAGLPVITAWWVSADGRSRRIVVAPTSGELAARLREIGPPAVSAP